MSKSGCDVPVMKSANVYFDFIKNIFFFNFPIGHAPDIAASFTNWFIRSIAQHTVNYFKCLTTHTSVSNHKKSSLIRHIESTVSIYHNDW